MLRRAWSDPVWSKVIAGAILAVAAALWTFFAGWWPDIANAVGAAFDFVTAKTLTPNWLLGLLSLCSCALVIIAALAIIDARSGPLMVTYRMDRILGVKWRWKYDANLAIYDLAPFCPTCDFQAIYVDLGQHRFPHLGIKCEDCNQVFADFKSVTLISEIEDRVEREIQRKLRSGDWLNVVSKQ